MCQAIPSVDAGPFQNGHTGGWNIGPSTVDLGEASGLSRGRSDKTNECIGIDGGSHVKKGLRLPRITIAVPVQLSLDHEKSEPPVHFT